MTDSALLPHQSRLTSVTVDDKTHAFRSASRHSSHVRWLRRLILLGASAGCLGILAFVLFDPFRVALPASVSIDSAGLNGSRVTMNRPKMSGFRKDGRPYDFIAKTAVQDMKVPNVLELNELDAHVTMSDKGVAHVTADLGTYDSSRENMDLRGNIHITSDSGYDIHMKTAHVEFSGGVVASNDPVMVVMKTGTVAADAMHMSGNGTDVTFEGHVHSVMLPGGATTAPIGSKAVEGHP